MKKKLYADDLSIVKMKRKLYADDSSPPTSSVQKPHATL